MKLVEHKIHHPILCHSMELTFAMLCTMLCTITTPIKLQNISSPPKKTSESPVTPLSSLPPFPGNKCLLSVYRFMHFGIFPIWSQTICDF